VSVEHVGTDWTFIVRGAVAWTDRWKQGGSTETISRSELVEARPFQDREKSDPNLLFSSPQTHAIRPQEEKKLTMRTPLDEFVASIAVTLHTSELKPVSHADMECDTKCEIGSTLPGVIAPHGPEQGSDLSGLTARVTANGGQAWEWLLGNRRDLVDAIETAGNNEELLDAALRAGLAAWEASSLS
jgi:hypothetical protein